MRNVFIPVEPKPLPPKRKGYPFAGAAPAVTSLSVFKTRRITFPEEEVEVFRKRKDLAWMFAGAPPVVVNKLTFLRKSSYTAEEEVYENLSPDKRRRNPLFLSTAQSIILANGPGPGQPGSISIVGGTQRMQIFIGGVEVTNCSTADRSIVAGLGASVGAQPLRLSAQTIGRWGATFDLLDKDGSFTPQLGQTVLIQENGLRILAGCITALVPEIFDGATFVVYHVTTADKSAIFDHRVLLQRFFIAGTDIADVIRSFFTDVAYCNPPLENEGITLNNVPTSLGPLSQDLGPYNLTVITKVLDDLATDLAGVWFVDTLGDLHMTPIASLGAAPFGLDATTPNFRRASMATSLADFRTKQYAISDRNVTPATNAPNITGTPIVETWTLPQALAGSLGYLPLSIVTNFPMLKVTGLKVNGVDQPIYIGTQYPPINFRHVWWYFPQTNNLIPPSITNNNIAFSSPALTSADPANGDVVEISYIAPQQAAQVVQNDPLAPTFGTCGSGVYEVVEQVKGVDSQDVLNQIATAILARSGDLPKTISFETDRPGLAVGQSLPVNLPRLDLTSTNLMITSMDGTIMAGRLAFGSRMRWQVKATNTQDLGNWIKYMERLIRRTDNTIPVNRYEEAAWILGNGSSLAGGTVQSNPYYVRNTGQVFLAFAGANNGPTDQTLTIDVVSDAQGSLLTSGPTPLVIPAGSTALVKVTQFLGDPAPLFMIKDDRLTVVATYTVTGANPVAAANVSFGMRWFY